MRFLGVRRFAAGPMLIALLIVATHCSGGLREDEMHCEEAVSQLVRCCPGFDAHAVNCSYSDACGTTYPSLSVTESQCLEAQTCDSIAAAGMCQRAQNAEPIVDIDGGGTSAHDKAVCP